MRVVFIDTLAITDLDGGFLHNHCSDPESDCGGLLGWTPATQWYKVRPCHIKTHEIAGFCAGCIRYQAGDILLDGRYLHSRWLEFESVCGRLLGLSPAFQRYKVRLCRIRAQEFAVFCGGYTRYKAGDILLNGRLLDDLRTDSDVLYGRLLSMTQASP